jgi:hypothetical protein
MIEATCDVDLAKWLFMTGNVQKCLENLYSSHKYAKGSRSPGMILVSIDCSQYMLSAGGTNKLNFLILLRMAPNTFGEILQIKLNL